MHTFNQTCSRYLSNKNRLKKTSLQLNLRATSLQLFSLLMAFPHVFGKTSRLWCKEQLVVDRQRESMPWGIPHSPHGMLSSLVPHGLKGVRDHECWLWQSQNDSMLASPGRSPSTPNEVTGRNGTRSTEGWEHNHGQSRRA